MSAADFLKLQHWILGPTWRVQFAQQHQHSGLSQAYRAADPALSEIFRGLNVSDRAASQGTSSNVNFASPSWAIVNALNCQTELVGWLKLFTLVGLAREEIEKSTGLSRQVLQRWQMAFFDVEGFLTSDVWLHANVIHPEVQAGRWLWASRLKFALGGGPVVARKILQAETRSPRDETERKEFQALQIGLQISAARLEPCKTESARLRQIKNLQEEIAQEQRLNATKLQTEAQILADERRPMEPKRRQPAQAAREQLQAQRDDERRASARAASSPLAKLRWKSAAVPQRHGEALRQSPGLCDQASFTATIITLAKDWRTSGELEQRGISVVRSGTMAPALSDLSQAEVATD